MRPVQRLPNSESSTAIFGILYILIVCVVLVVHDLQSVDGVAFSSPMMDLVHLEYVVDITK